MSATTFPNGLSFAKRSTGIGQLNVVQRVKAIRIGHADGTAETSTGFDLPSLCYVDDVFINVRTAEATGVTKTIDIGILTGDTDADPNGFGVGLSVAATGLVRAEATVTVGGTETYFSATTRGALLTTFLAGANVATDTGTNYEKPFLCANPNNTISWTPGSADFAELSADIYIVYREIV